MGAEPPTATAYLAARAVVAACGVAAVALQFAFARHLMAAGPALFSAALLAVSLVAVQTAHSVRPDVALQVFYLLALIAMLRLDGRPRAGPARGRGPRRRRRDQVLRRVPRPRADRAPAAGARPPRRAASCSPGPRAAAVFVIASPYSVLHLGEFVEGVETQVVVPLRREPGPRARAVLRRHGRPLPRDLGAGAGDAGHRAVGPRPRGGGAGAAALGAAAARAPATAIAVFATSQVRHDRFLLPALVVAFALAAAGWAEVWTVSRRLAVARRGGRARACRCSPPSATCGTCRVPAPATARSTGRPRRCRAGARVLTRLDLGLDESRVEVFKVPRLDQRVAGARVGCRLRHPSRRSRPARRPRARWRRSSPAAATTAPRSPPTSVPDALRPRRACRSRWPAPRSPSSSGAATLPAAIDGRPDTWWRTDEIQQAGDFVAVELGRERRSRRARAGARTREPRFAARELQLQVRRGRILDPPALGPRPHAPGGSAPSRQPGAPAPAPGAGGRGPPGPHPERGAPLGHRGARVVAQRTADRARGL